MTVIGITAFAILQGAQITALLCATETLGSCESTGFIPAPAPITSSDHNLSNLPFPCVNSWPERLVDFPLCVQHWRCGGEQNEQKSFLPLSPHFSGNCG